MDLSPSLQLMGNSILAAVGSVALYLLYRLVRAIETVATVGKLSLNPSSTQPSLPVSKKEIERMIDPNEGGRYAKFTFPESMRPFKEPSLA